MGREAFDCEWPRDADARLVLKGPVVEKLYIGLLRNRLVDLSLPRDALLPPCGMSLLRLVRPAGRGFTGDFPFLPLLAERGIQVAAQRLQLRLELIPYNVNLGVARNRTQHNVRGALVDETLANIPMCGGIDRRLPGYFPFLETPFLAVGEQIVRIARAHH